MRVLFSRGDDELARVFVAETEDGHRLELVDQTPPPLPRSERWVLLVSALMGCPVRCAMCDVGGHYEGKLTSEEILDQVDYLIRRRHPDGRVPVPALEVHFTRMGDPAFNEAVIDALCTLPRRYQAPGLTPCLSTIAPARTEAFFERLIEVKRALYSGGRFQLQLSLHTTDELVRRRLVPVKCLPFSEMAELGRRLAAPGDRKIDLNFVAAREVPLEPGELLRHFSPEIFTVKLTQMNPTLASFRTGLTSLFEQGGPQGVQAVVERFCAAGYQVVVSPAAPGEAEIGSGCGMRAAAPLTQVPRPRRTRAAPEDR